MRQNSCVLILAGGIGTRLWPKSRRFKPKQFLKLYSEETLIQQTVARIRPLFPLERIWLVVKPFQKEEVMRQVPDIPPDNILSEPVPKGTAAAISWASAIIEHAFPGCTLAVLPSDHLVKDHDRFRDLLDMGIDVASEHPVLVTYGVRPFRPETSYGYIEIGNPLPNAKVCPCYTVKSFHEKPDRKTAKKYISEGRFLWNSGIFIFTIRVFFDSIKHYSIELWRPLERILAALTDPVDMDVVNRLYVHLPDLSIDEALFERAENVVVLPADFKWHDIGLWSSIYEILPKDRQGNALEGKVITIDCKDCLLVSEEDGLIAAIGMKKVAVIMAKNAVLVCPLERLDQVREVVKRIRTLGYIDFF